MRILSECGDLTAAPKHVCVRRRREACCGHITGNVVENLQIGFDFTFFDNMLDACLHPRRLGPIMEKLRQPQNKMIGIEPAAENDGVDMFEQAGVAAECAKCA